MSFPRYPKYKDSGVEWLGEVPEGWEVKPNKAFLSPRKSCVGSEWQQVTLLSLTLNGVIPRDIESGVGKFPSDFDTYQHVAPDDLVFCLFDMDETPRTVGLAKSRGMVTGAYDVFQCRDGVHPNFLFYYYLHIDSFKGLRPFYTGLRKVVRPPTFMAVKVPLPPAYEQAQIASFLDKETGRIDELVAEQRRLMELLKEKRQAVISHAVTKGLNPRAPMKPSNIEWLGDVPEHWEIVAAKRVSTVFVPQRNKPELNSEPTGLGWITMEQMGPEEIDTPSLWVSDEAAQQAGSRPLKAGAVIASCVGSFGVASINTADVIINQQLQAFIPGERIDRRFLRYCVASAGSYFEQVGTAATIIYVNQQGFENLPLPLPPLPEQIAILDSIGALLAQLDALAAEAQKAIELLQERRTALISAAVTGQIDVRKLAAA